MARIATLETEGKLAIIKRSIGGEIPGSTIIWFDGYWVKNNYRGLYPGGSPREVVDSEILPFLKVVVEQVSCVLYRHYDEKPGYNWVISLGPRQSRSRMSDLSAIRRELSQDTGLLDKGRLVHLILGGNRFSNELITGGEQYFCGLRSKSRADYRNYDAFQWEIGALLKDLSHLDPVVPEAIADYLQDRDCDTCNSAALTNGEYLLEKERL